MKKEVNLGIGFITGRPNVCKIINNYSDYLVEQVQKLNYKVNITIFILYDLNYQHTIHEDFYAILPKVYKNVNIKYITPENIEESKKRIMTKYNLTNKDVNLFIGNGYAKARNTILYYALKKKMDYLLFWDDDEYPLANIKSDEGISWVKQQNILKHLENIEKADLTMGYRCGMMNPVPYIQYTDQIQEKDYKDFIDALENEVVSWKKIELQREENSSILYADETIAYGSAKPEKVKNIGSETFVLGSGICLNLRHLDKIPAFYNPPEARGEDTFFSCGLQEKKATVLKIPTYHFHDSFLRYTSLMRDKFPKRLPRIALEDNDIEQRFLKATVGWIKYKPLFYYITQRENYREFMDGAKDKLVRSVPKINTAFKTCDFSCLIHELEEYDKNVQKHYQEFSRITKIWDELKYKLVEDFNK